MSILRSLIALVVWSVAGTVAPAALARPRAAPAVYHAPGAVSAANPLAAAAGQQMLRAGGSATDAAMAMLLALTVVEPQSSGIGGGGFLLHHDGVTGKLITIDGRETAPAAARPDRFMGPDGKPLAFTDAFPGGLSVGVPGNVALMAAAHRQWGKLPWKQLFDPAIRLAEQGYVVSPELAGWLARTPTLWTSFPAARAIYYQDGRPKRAGERVTNPALAAFLRDLARKGPRAFYSGQNAQAIMAATGRSARNPATISASDLSRYKVAQRPAVCGAYREYRVCSMGPPSSGATTVLGILGMLERFPMRELGPNDATSWHLISEAMRLAYADRELYLGDPAFVMVPVAGLIDPTYLSRRAELISATRARDDYPAGDPPGAPKRQRATGPDDHGTTHFVATDRNGDVVSMTSTIEGIFGSQLIANGYFLNNELTDFTFAPVNGGYRVANRVEPGKRPLSSMSPTIVYDAEGKVVLALGSAGGKRIIMHVVKTLVGFIDWRLDARQAIALANIWMAGDAVQIEAGTPVAGLMRDIAIKGRTTLTSDLDSKVNAVEWRNGQWVGAADPRSEGVALPQ